jgi:hypothetical protein
MGQDNSKDFKSEYLSEWQERKYIPTPEHNLDGLKSESEIKQELAINQLNKLQILKNIEFWYGVISSLLIISIIMIIIFVVL